MDGIGFLRWSQQTKVRRTLRCCPRTWVPAVRATRTRDSATCMSSIPIPTACGLLKSTIRRLRRCEWPADRWRAPSKMELKSVVCSSVTTTGRPWPNDQWGAQRTRKRTRTVPATVARDRDRTAVLAATVAPALTTKTAAAKKPTTKIEKT